MLFPRKAFLTNQFKLCAPVLNIGVYDGIGIDMDTIRYEITWLSFYSMVYSMRAGTMFICSTSSTVLDPQKAQHDF